MSHGRDTILSIHDVKLVPTSLQSITHYVFMSIYLPHSKS